MITLYWTEQSTRQEPEGGDAVDMVIARLDLDIVEADTYEVSALITDHSVELREQITDHQVPEHDRARVDVVISESPLNTILVDGAAFSDVTLPNGAAASVITTPEGTTRRADVFDTLRRLCREGINVDVDGLRRPIEGWMIESISSPRTVMDVGALVCSIELKEVTTASTEDVEAPSPRVERGRRRRDRGRQRPRSTDDTGEVLADAEGRDTGLSSLYESYYNTETGEPLP